MSSSDSLSICHSDRNNSLLVYCFLNDFDMLNELSRRRTKLQKKEMFPFLAEEEKKMSNFAEILS